MGWENDQILPLTIWGQGLIRHKISSVTVSPNFKHFVTGSWDGNIFIWDLNSQNESSILSPRWIVTGQTSAVSAVACFDGFFVSCHMDGVTCHYQLPSGRLLKRLVDHNYIHTHAVALEDNHVMCAGFYPDIVVLDAYTLDISMYLQSREQADWVACFRSFPKENGIQVQGITTSGFLKTWSLNDAEDGVCLESSLGPMGVRHSKTMAFHMARRWLLLVTTSQVLVFDVSIHVVFKHTTKDALEGGDFLNDKVVFWTKHGDLFECDVKSKVVRKILQGCGTELHVPGNRLVRVGENSFFVAADIKGTLAMWRLESAGSVVPHHYASADASRPAAGHGGLIDHLGISVVCSVHISHLNKFIAGCSDGKLLIFPATDLLLAHFFQNPKPDFVCLSGHRGAVRCVLYPHSEESSYQESLLVSGGDDFSVCLWDIFRRELLHRFCVHSGPVVRLLTPPAECSSRVASAVCSVSLDHSVAILSLRDRRCAFLASQHPFPIVAVRWKPFHDFLVVKCFDGSVFVWELRTGVLDRVVCGVAAEEVVYDCDQAKEDVLWDFYTAGPSEDELPRLPLYVSPTRDTGPVLLCGLLTAPHTEVHVLLLNISKLSCHLQTIFPGADPDPDVFRKIHALAKPPDPTGLHKTISNVLDHIKQEADHLQEKFHLSIYNVSSINVEKTSIQRKVSGVSGTQLIPYAQLALSLLHVWGEDKQVDEVSVSKLGLIQPFKARSFDLASEQSCLSLRHPCNEEVERSRWDLVAMSALCQVLDKFSFSLASSEMDEKTWPRLVHFLESLPLTSEVSSFEKLAALWQTKSPSVRKFVKHILPEQLLTLSSPDCLDLVGKWLRFLPDDGSSDSNHLLTIAIVICSILTVDGKIDDKELNNMKATSDSLRFVVTSSKMELSLVATAIDLLGRGFLVWERLFPVDEALVAIFERCSEYPDADLILTSRTAIEAIARGRLSQFIAHLKFMCKTAHPILEQSKSEILSLMRQLLIDLPMGLVALLSDAVEVVLACIDPAHLREAELPALLGVWLPQLHHHVAGQRVGVGMPDGKVIVHDLRARRAHVLPAHDTAIAAIHFSPDGKLLIALSFSGAGSLWQLSHGLFDLGVGQFRFRNVRMFPMVIPIDKLKEGVNISWVDMKSINIETLHDSDRTAVTLSI